MKSIDKLDVNDFVQEPILNATDGLLNKRAANDDGETPELEGEVFPVQDGEANDNTPNELQGLLAEFKDDAGAWADEHLNVQEGRCQSAKKTLKSAVYFVCRCFDDDVEPETSLPDWDDVETYRKALDYAFDHARLSDISPTKTEKSKRSIWAKIIKYVHNEGDYRVDEDEFMEFVGTFKDGIRGLYNHAVQVLGKDCPGRGGRKGGSTGKGATSSAAADALAKAKLADIQNPNYVLILLDANQGKGGKRKNNPRSPQSIVNSIGRMDQFVTSWNPSHEDVNGDGGILAMFREDIELVASDDDEVEAVQASGGDDE